ncbi:MAG: polysaccharide deacetylase family protein [Clostridiales bacterium]|nr:polysaccharide deacetylase family protein [Clostridiales bacterium]
MLVLFAAAALKAASPAAKSVFSAAVAKTERLLPIYCVETDKPQIAISFDAAWGADDTDKLLEILDEYDVKTTFFMCGYWVDKYPDEVKKIAEAGHDIGNHSATHPHMSQLTKEQIIEELTTAGDKVKELTGIEMELFRAPFGEYTNDVISAAEECGYYTIQWDIDSLDWKEYGTEAEIEQVLNHKHLGNGSIILFHNDAKYTPEALGTIIEGLQDKGYEIVPVSELIIRENYTINNEGRQIADAA